MKYLIRHVAPYFEGVVVNIGDLPVDSFYISLGFKPAEDSDSYAHIYSLV